MVVIHHENKNFGQKNPNLGSLLSGEVIKSLAMKVSRAATRRDESATENNNLSVHPNNTYIAGYRIIWTNHITIVNYVSQSQ